MPLLGWPTGTKYAEVGPQREMANGVAACSPRVDRSLWRLTSGRKQARFAGAPTVAKDSRPSGFDV